VIIPRGVNARILIRALLDDGFSEARVEGSHHRFKHPDGRAVTVAYSRHNDTFTIGTLHRMIHDARWTENDLRRLRLIE
jgi:predicted RNA binding protein YcfA (HicA-like mRNA interferase family)